MSKNNKTHKCLTVLLWERASAGARRYEMLFDDQGRVVETFATKSKGPRYSGAYVVLVEPGKNYYLLFLRLTNVKESTRGPKQNKYGSLEIIRYEQVGLFKEYFDTRWWPSHIADYPLCRKVIQGVVWRYEPWSVKKDLEEWPRLPTKIAQIIGLFEHKVEYYGDLDSLIRDLEQPQS